MARDVYIICYCCAFGVSRNILNRGTNKNYTHIYCFKALPCCPEFSPQSCGTPFGFGDIVNESTSHLVLPAVTVGGANVNFSKSILWGAKSRETWWGVNVQSSPDLADVIITYLNVVVAFPVVADVSSAREVSLPRFCCFIATPHIYRPRNT